VSGGIGGSAGRTSSIGFFLTPAHDQAGEQLFGAGLRSGVVEAEQRSDLGLHLDDD
jgi:hypothetical protein